MNVGSNPATPTIIYLGVAQLEERLIWDQEVSQVRALPLRLFSSLKDKKLQGYSSVG